MNRFSQRKTFFENTLSEVLDIFEFAFKILSHFMFEEEILLKYSFY